MKLHRANKDKALWKLKSSNNSIFFLNKEIKKVKITFIFMSHHNIFFKKTKNKKIEINNNSCPNYKN
jgi:ATPase subunit of ABC transporter with duplicated ATPase domains